MKFPAAVIIRGGKVNEEAQRMFSMVPFRGVARGGDGFYNPFGDDLFRMFLGNDLAGGVFSAQRPLQVDIRDEGDHYLMEADLPGMSRENVHVDVDGDVLTISTEVNDTRESEEEGRYVCRERRYGRSSRSFNLDGVRADGIDAEFKDGVLRLTLPKREVREDRASRAVEIR